MPKPLPPEVLEARPYLADDATAQHPSNGDYVGPPPVKYTPAVHQQIVENIQRFNRPAVAAQMAGITASTFHAWMRMGNEGNVHLVQFVEDIEQAIAVAEGKALKVVTTAFDDEDGPEHAKWYLERTRSAGYSKEVNAKVEGILAEAMERLRAGLTEPEFRRVLAVLSGSGVESLEGPSRFQLTPKSDDE